MEKLIFTSSNPIPSKLNLKPRHSLPRLVRFAVPKLGFSSTELRRFNSLSCKHHDSSRPVSRPPSSSPAEKLSAFSPLPENLPDRKTHFIQQFADAFSQQQKAVSAGSVLLLSALFVILVQPIFVSPAFASFQAAIKTGPLVRSELLSSAWTGFLAGCLHTLSGPDHLAALAPLSIGRTRVESALVGALWGCGHDAGQVIFGLLFLLLKDRLHIEIIRTWGTRVVAFTLLVIGAMGIREASEVSTHYVVAVENGLTPCLDGALEVPAMEKKKKVGLATFATGIIHGLQPDALMMVLPALALPSRVAGAAFLGMFLVGTVVAMGSYTVFIGSCSQALKDRVPRITEKLTWASSLVAIALGCGIIISQFFGFSLY